MNKEIIERLIIDYKDYAEREKRYLDIFWKNKDENLHAFYRYRWQKAVAVKDYLQNLLDDISRGE